MKEVLNYIEQNKEKYLDELLAFLKIPSISSAEEHKPDMEKAAKWLSGNIKECGFEDVRIIPTEGHSIIFGQWLGAGKDAHTVLIYGHYDVQPVDPLDLWQSPPFEPVIRNNKIYGRGTSDDKGQVFVHLKALQAFMNQKGKLPVNVKILIEGEEEANVSHLDEFIINNKELLACDTVIISDTEWFADGIPSICYGLRGIAFVEVTVTGPNRDLHSGTFGGAIDNPLFILCRMISQLKDCYGRITIPGFYKDVLDLTEEEKQNYLKLPYNEAAYCEDLDIKGVNGEYGYTTLERVWARPALDINGITGGYTGEGLKTILPTKASAKITTRLVPHQKPDEIVKLLGDYLKKLAPPTVKVEVQGFPGGNPVLVPMDSKGVKACSKAMTEAFGTVPVFMREGGSIPIVETFMSVLNAPSVLMGLGLPGDNIHSPNENYDLDNFYGGIKASALFFEEMGR
jgi:acetylornithine deacetylase/succinyl-diaminopimelate desuccinylase-like protein